MRKPEGYMPAGFFLLKQIWYNTEMVKLEANESEVERWTNVYLIGC